MSNEKWQDPAIQEFTVSDVCQILVVREDRLYQWRKRGKGPKSYKRDHRVYYSRKALEDWFCYRKGIRSEQREEEEK